MEHSMKFANTKMIAVAALAAVPMLASAQLSANLSLTSNYKFRGQDQDVITSAGVSPKDKAVKPALQGGFDYAHSSGFYVGNWNSSVNWLTGNSLEVDVYGGYKGEIMKDLGYDVGVLAYLYPGNTNGNTTEIYGGLSYGPFTAKYSHTVSSDYFFYGSKAGYLNVGYAQEITKGLTVKASLGATRFKNAALVDFMDYSIGAAYDLGSGFSVTGALVGATKKASYNTANDNRLVITLTKSM
jgi:uncharacterized protein (TIGR02001 family)